MRRSAELAAAVCVLYLALIQPNHPEAMTPGAFAVFPLELPLVAAALIAVRGTGSWALRIFVSAALTSMVVVKLADFAARIALDRPFNLLTDWHLAPAAWRLLSGTLGVPLALAAGAAGVGAIALLAAALWWATGRIAALQPPERLRPALRLLLIPAAALVFADAAREVSPANPPGAAFTSRLAWEHGRDAWRAAADRVEFQRLAAEDWLADAPPEEILAGLRGTDVALIFVESYGRSALEHPLYAPTIRATLAETEADLLRRGLAMRSGFLTAPVVGGQSWLAHASLLSGLRIDDQSAYRALLASPRRTLIQAAKAAGWRTVAVMPAITLAWPEAGFFGYDRVLAAHDLGYAGLPFNWVTMPDQFTLAAFARQELTAADRSPVFAEIVLISSHAPWTPIPPLLAWDALGDGRVFDRYANLGDAPEAIWRDLDRVRDQFRRALDYSLRGVGAFTVRAAGRPRLTIVLGDHQPARFVSLDETSHDVPVHLIGPPDLLARIGGWGWSAGLLPEADAPVWGMEAFRDRFLAAFAAADSTECAKALKRRALPNAAGC